MLDYHCQPNKCKENTKTMSRSARRAIAVAIIAVASALGIAHGYAVSPIAGGGVIHPSPLSSTYQAGGGIYPPAPLAPVGTSI